MNRAAVDVAASAGRTEPVPIFTRIFSGVFTFPAMLAGMLVLLAFCTVRDRFNDSDTWWHLRIGQSIWTTHTIPRADFFSYTTHHHAWVPHEWLTQLSLFTFYHFAGYQGMMLWLVVLTAALLIAGYFLCTIYSGNAKTAFAGALVLWVFSTAGLSPRPQLAGYLLMVAELILLELGRRRSPRWFFALPLLFALWVNVHGSFSFGLMILAVTLVCSYVTIDRGLLVSSAWDRSRRNVLVLCAALSVAALSLNPDGIKQVLYPLDTLLHQPVSLRVVEEWQPLTVASGRGIALVLTIAAIVLILLIRQFKLHLDEFMLLSLGTWLALEHQRMVFVFGILAAPILARLLAPLWDGYDPQADSPWLNATMMLCVLLIVWRWFPTQSKLAQIVRDRNPSGAVQYIREHHLPGPMLNAYSFGGYLIWALPEQPVFVDGRGDVYEWTGIMPELERWVTLQDDPNKLLDQYHIHFCLLQNGEPMVRVVSLLPGWKQVYADRVAVILERTGASASQGKQ